MKQIIIVSHHTGFGGVTLSASKVSSLYPFSRSCEIIRWLRQVVQMGHECTHSINDIFEGVESFCGTLVDIPEENVPIFFSTYPQQLNIGKAYDPRATRASHSERLV